MIGRKSKQLCMVIMDIKDLIPQDHLLRKIKAQIDFDFIYEQAESYYSKIGRPSIDPVCLMKMLLIGYLYGIRSERRLEEEITLNIAYRWFYGFELMDVISDHSTFSQNRRRRFTDSAIFRQIFNMLVNNCIETGLVLGETAVTIALLFPSLPTMAGNTAAEWTIIPLNYFYSLKKLSIVQHLSEDLRATVSLSVCTEHSWMSISRFKAE